MLADRIRMSVFQSTKKDDPLGSVGSQDLILGDSMAGYFGTVNGLVTNTELTNLMNMTSGTLLDSANTDITFHKFIHKGRILLIPSRPIKHTISWDNIQAQNGVKGKVISINGPDYLCRLMTGSRHYYTGNNSIAGGEWNALILEFYDIMGSFETPKGTFCSDVDSAGITQRVWRGWVTNKAMYSYMPYTQVSEDLSWRPVLEVL